MFSQAKENYPKKSFSRIRFLGFNTIATMEINPCMPENLSKRIIVWFVVWLMAAPEQEETSI